jgi:hypothetical protein
MHSLGVAGQGAVWTEDELPISLHTFAYVAGEALCAWWRAIGNDKATDGP